MSGATKQGSSVERMDIELKLSHGRTIRRTVRSDDTLGALVHDLRGGGELMGVSSIRVGTGNSLLTSDNWRYKKIGNIGLRHGGQIHITTVRPTEVHISCYEPGVRWAVNDKTVSISASEGATLNVVEEKLRALGVDPEKSSAVSFQELSAYYRADRPRRAVKSFNSNIGEYLFVDEITGVSEIRDQREQLVLTFLSSGSGLIAAPNYTPVLEMHMQCEVLTFDDKGDLRPAYLASLLFPSALLLFRGLRMRSRTGATVAVMLRMCNGEYLSIETGAVYASADAAVGPNPNTDGTWNHVTMLADSSSTLPKYKIPEGKTISVFKRYGWAVSLTQRGVQGEATERAESGSMWEANSPLAEFDHQLTRKMRR